jgi:Flp pilus assembly pilin Flp
MKFKNFSKKLLKNQSGQGATEYILLLVVVVALVMAFKGKIMSIMSSQVDALGSSISQVGTSSN